MGVLIVMLSYLGTTGATSPNVGLVCGLSTSVLELLKQKPLSLRCHLNMLGMWFGLSASRTEITSTLKIGGHTVDLSSHFETQFVGGNDFSVLHG